MRLHRFYIAPHNTKNIGLQDVVIDDTALIHQLIRVFRYKIDSEIILFDGLGNECVYAITHITDRTISLSLRKVLGASIISRHVTVAFSVIKKQNTELILQKCTELGATEFQPIVSDRTERVQFDSDRARKIVIEATEQSGHHVPPIIHDPISLKEYCAALDAKNVIVFHATGTPFGKKDISSQASVVILIGPEGGWTDQEVSYFSERGFSIHTLGEYTLRAETAAIVATGLVQCRE